jgi:hypothetical protein
MLRGGRLRMRKSLSGAQADVSKFRRGEAGVDPLGAQAQFLTMQYQTTLTYSEPLIRQAVWGFWRRVVGFRFVFLIALVAASLAFLVLGGDRSWLVGVIATILIFGVLFSAAVFSVHYRNSAQKFRELCNGQASMTATPQTLSFFSAAGTSSIPWKSIREVWQFQTFWLILFSKAHFATLPLKDISPELQDFILERVSATGGKISK